MRALTPCACRLCDNPFRTRRRKPESSNSKNASGKPPANLLGSCHRNDLDLPPARGWLVLFWCLAKERTPAIVVVGLQLDLIVVFAFFVPGQDGRAGLVFVALGCVAAAESAHDCMDHVSSRRTYCDNFSESCRPTCHSVCYK